jgi:hypothetical protein
LQKTAEETAFNSPSEIDARTFIWTLDSLDEDHELERFFSGLPSFRSSKVVNDPLPSRTREQKRKLCQAVMGLFDRTFSSDLLPESVKTRRAIICAKALDPTTFPHEYLQIVNRIMFDDQCRGLKTTEFGHTMRAWGNSGNQDGAIVGRAIVTGIIAGMQRQDDSWFNLAANELGVPETVLQDYAAHGNSLSLAILIYVTRQQFSHFREWFGLMVMFSDILQAASKFNVQDTSPELQHDFCALWNQIVLKAQNDHGHMIAWFILGPIRNIYIALHKDTHSAPTRFSASTGNWDDILRMPSSYPVCSIAGHIHASTDFPPTVLYDNATLPPASLFSPDAPSSSIPTPLYVGESLMTEPQLDNDIYVSGSFHPAYQTHIENLRIPATSQDPVTARVIRGGISSDTSTSTIPFSTPERSVSTPPTSMASTSPPGAVAVQHIADRHTSSDVLDVPSLPSPTLALDNMFPTGLQSSLDSPVTGSDHTSSPESHSSLLALAVPGPSRPWLSSAPHLSAAIEGEGSVKAALHKERDALDPPLAENIMAAPDLPPQSPSPPSVTGIAFTGRSRRSLDAEHTGHHRPHPSHGQYDIV